MFCEEQKGLKGFGRNEVSTNDFPHVTVIMCCVFDQSILVTCPKFDNLLPELELSISVILF